MPKVTFHIAGHATEVEDIAGKTILQIALDQGVSIEHACGGNGFCTTCLCTVKSGGENLAPRNDKEENMGITNENERLGCQAVVNGDVELEVLDA
ncbi:MAG: 2Fe-2S iron-sulfur cluster-binding protein [bacterium]|nr:2Fe-2S iron-sulfur cluster-binding protein [bacterium]MDA1292900.1 2Fe-2S iron-sulfur cluster-binding protein [bacterium]